MRVTINIPDEVARQVLAQGRALETYVQSLVVSAAATQPFTARLGPGPYTPQEAGHIRELRKGNTLGEIKIKDLDNAELPKQPQV